MAVYKECSFHSNLRDYVELALVELGGVGGGWAIYKWWIYVVLI